MCGIAGVRRYGETPITAEEIKILLCKLEHRGNHATGMALMGADGHIHVVKDAVPAWTFISQKTTLDFLETFLPDARMAILHTRFATIGNPLDNHNNHPMFMGESAVVHNGSIHNHNDLFDNVFKTPRSCETDSDVFRAAFDKYGMTREALDALNKAAGSAAIAAFSEADPDALILARSGSPLTYAVSDDKLWWASEIRAIQSAIRPIVKKHGLLARVPVSGVGYFGMPDDTAYILRAGGNVQKFEFKTCSRYVAPVYDMQSSYHRKMTEFKRVKKLESTTSTATASSSDGYLYKQLPCPKTGCNGHNKIPIGDKWFKYECATCGTSLRGNDAIPAANALLLK